MKTNDSERAAYYRLALYLGLESGEAAVAWADELVSATASPSDALIELAMTKPGDVTSLRHALLPLAGERPSDAVVGEVLGIIAEHWHGGRRSFADTITVLKQLRDTRLLAPAIAEDLLRFELRAYGATPEKKAALEAELAAWLAARSRL